MAEIGKITDAYIDEVIKSNTNTPDPSKTQGAGLRQLVKSLRDRSEQELDKRKGAALYGPYPDLFTVISTVTTERYQGLTVGVITNEGIVEYWWKDGLANEDLIVKSNGSSSGEPVLQHDITSTVTEGNINAGDVLPQGMTYTEFVERLLVKTFVPTFVAPSFGLSNNVSGVREIGAALNLTLTFNFNRGQILGNVVNGVWNPSAVQNPRAGTANSYTLNGVTQPGNTLAVNNYTVQANNVFSGIVNYAQGPQPKNSMGANYGTPLDGGTSPAQTSSFIGVYPYFYYKSNSLITPAMMQAAIVNGQASKVVASSAGTITAPFAANGEFIAIAYPAASATKTVWYVNELDKGSIPGGVFGAASQLNCNSPENYWTNIAFKIHTSEGPIKQPNPIELRNS